jgi:hypothetical protein
MGSSYSTSPSSTLNGSKIKATCVEDDIDDAEEVMQYYQVRPTTSHAFVICGTACNNAVKCQLLAADKSLTIHVGRSYWKPKKKKVTILRRSTSISSLKAHLDELKITFGPYTWGSHDCRHFSDEIVNFLQK